MGDDSRESVADAPAEQPKDEAEEHQDPADTHDEQVSIRELVSNPAESRDVQEIPEPSRAKPAIILETQQPPELAAQVLPLCRSQRE